MKYQWRFPLIITLLTLKAKYIVYISIHFSEQLLSTIWWFILLSLQRHRRSPHIWYHLLPTFLGLLAQANSQCFGGVETYEKTSGTTVMCDNASECNIRGLVTQEDTSVTRDCIAICKQSSACTTFTVGKYIIISIQFMTP